MIRHRKRHDLASTQYCQLDGPNNWTEGEKEGNLPCSTCGSSNVTAFSTSVPPTLLVLGIGANDANHHNGKITNPIKKHHAWNGDASSSSFLRCSAHEVGLTGAGRRGSRIWYVLDRLTEGAWGAMSALMGIDISEILPVVRRSALRWYW